MMMLPAWGCAARSGRGGAEAAGVEFIEGGVRVRKGK
jgi:hypothetical protein